MKIMSVYLRTFLVFVSSIIFSAAFAIEKPNKILYDTRVDLNPKTDRREILQGALLLPYPKYGSKQGLQIKSMLKDSKLRTYGLQENDIILKIDGISTKWPKKFSEAFENNPKKIEILRPQTLELNTSL